MLFLWQVFPATCQFLLNCRKGSILHLVKREPVRLEGALGTDEICQLIAPVPHTVECRVVKHVGRADQLPVTDLEPETDDPGWPVKTGTVGIAEADRHQGTVVGTPHPPGHKNRGAERVQDLTYGRETALGPDDHDRVVLAPRTARQ